MGELLEMREITKSFPGVKALDGVSLTVKAGTVHALMGENGAGKSTLMKCLFGIYGKDGGSVTLDGVPADFKSPRDALNHGVAMVHQELNQALKRSVNDNIWLGRYPTRLGVFTSDREMQRKTLEIFDELGIECDPKTIMSKMSVSRRQMVEIAKAVSYGAKVIVFDEPTSSLSETEAEHLFKIIDMLKRRGCGIIYISHKMEEILRISDEVTIMRDGKTVATEAADTLTMEKIIRLMVGRELTERFPPKKATPGKVVLKVEGLTAEHNFLSDVSFELREGEILGVAGLGGSGRTELLETLFGARAKRSGEITLRGSRVKNRNPREAKSNGFALITEERRAGGIFGILSITENTVISSLENYSVGPLLSSGKMKSEAGRITRSMRVKAPSLKTKIRTLSGGNQQKVIMGRWLLTDPQVFLMDEPTRGIDVGAKYEIYGLIQELAERGRSIIMVSSEMPELLGVCDRILVMSGGRLSGEVNAGNTSQEEIMALATRYV